VQVYICPMGKGVPKGGRGGHCPPDGQMFLKKGSIFEKIWYFWAKKWDFEPLKFFFSFCPL